MKTQEIGKCTSWIHGKYDCGEINTKLDYIVVNGKYTTDGTEFYVQGDDAYDAINEINNIYHADGIYPEDAFKRWINTYL